MDNFDSQLRSGKSYATQAANQRERERKRRKGPNGPSSGEAPGLPRMTRTRNSGGEDMIRKNKP